MEEKTLSGKNLFKGRVVELELRQVSLPDGRQAEREIIHHNGGAAVLALTADNKVLMVKQYRSAMAEMVLEIPAGKLELGEDPKCCAIRELEEETAFKARKIQFLGAYYPTPGYDTEILYLYLAEDLVQGKKNLDEDEFLECEIYDFQELLEMASKGELHDAKTAIAVMQTALLKGMGLKGSN